MGVVASLTGYGRAEARGTRVAIAVEARSLNHRFLEITLKLGRNLATHEAEVRRLLQGRLVRGRVDLTAVTRRIGGRFGVSLKGSKRLGSRESSPSRPIFPRSAARAHCP